MPALMEPHTSPPSTRARPRARRLGKSKAVAGRQGRALGDRAADPIGKKCPDSCAGSNRGSSGKCQGMGLDDECAAPAAPLPPPNAARASRRGPPALSTSHASTAVAVICAPTCRRLCFGRHHKRSATARAGNNLPRNPVPFACGGRPVRPVDTRRRLPWSRCAESDRSGRWARARAERGEVLALRKAACRGSGLAPLG